MGVGLSTAEWLACRVPNFAVAPCSSLMALRPMPVPAMALAHILTKSHSFWPHRARFWSSWGVGSVPAILVSLAVMEIEAVFGSPCWVYRHQKKAER